MLVILAIALSIVGFFLLFTGQIRLSRMRTIEGIQARVVGLVLLLTWPALFAAGLALGFIWAWTNGPAVASATNQQDLATLLLPYADPVRATAIAIVLIVAFVIAYWPSAPRLAPITHDEGLPWFPFAIVGLFIVLAVTICIYAANLGKPCQTFACARLDAAKTRVVLVQTQHVINTNAAITNTFLAPTNNVINTLAAMTFTAEAPTRLALSISAGMTSTAREATMYAYNATQSYLRTTPSPTHSPEQLALEGATATLEANRLATVTSAALAPRQQLPGKLIFMTKKGVKIGVFEPGGNNLHLFSIDNFFLGDVAGSPSGNQLAVTGRPRDGDSGIFITDMVGANLQRITNVNYTLADPVWSPDGRYIAAVVRTSPAWSKGVFEPQRNEASSLEIFGVNSFQEIRVYGTVDFIKTPSWSPDGKALAFCLLHPTSYGVYTTDLYTIAIDGSNLHQLTTSGNSCSPAWSPDGQHIAFLVNISGWHSDLYLMNPDGTGVRQLTQCLGGKPSWSPDSKHMVFTAGVTVNCFDMFVGDQRVFIYDLDSDALRNVTPAGFQDNVDSKSVSVASLSWTP